MDWSNFVTNFLGGFLGAALGYLYSYLVLEIHRIKRKRKDKDNHPDWDK